MVYVGANDGMLHAFIDSTSLADGGKEAWAYVPKALFSAGDPNDTERHTPAPEFQLGALSYRTRRHPAFQHKFYVNATPRIWDIDFANTNTETPPDDAATTGARYWSAGSAPAGARSMRSTSRRRLRCTDERTARQRVAARGEVLWEFTDANLGYVYDAPTLVKTKRYGWVALVASGYNNPGGKGYPLRPESERAANSVGSC